MLKDSGLRFNLISSYCCEWKSCPQISSHFLSLSLSQISLTLFHSFLWKSFLLLSWKWTLFLTLSLSISSFLRQIERKRREKEREREERVSASWFEWNGLCVWIGMDYTSSHNMYSHVEKGEKSRRRDTFHVQRERERTQEIERERRQGIERERGHKKRKRQKRRVNGKCFQTIFSFFQECHNVSSLFNFLFQNVREESQMRERKKREKEESILWRVFGRKVEKGGEKGNIK